MEKAKFLETLIKERGYNLKSFAAECGIPYTTLYGIIKNGVGKAGVVNSIMEQAASLIRRKKEATRTFGPTESYKRRQIQPFYDVGIMERSTLYHGSGQLYRIQIGHRSHSTCSPHLIGHLVQAGKCLFGLKLVCNGPSG